jgi:hypothetical protein
MEPLLYTHDHDHDCLIGVKWRRLSQLRTWLISLMVGDVHRKRLGFAYRMTISNHICEEKSKKRSICLWFL